jgi:protein TonB
MLDNFPSFESEFMSFSKFLGRNLDYPEKAIKKRKQGRVFTNFIINQFGEVIEIKVLKGICDEIDKEAVRVSDLYKWPIPIYKGEKTFVKINMPVKFSLD